MLGPNSKVGILTRARVPTSSSGNTKLSQRERLVFVFLTLIFLGLLTPLQLFGGVTQGEVSFEFLLCVLVLEICAIRIAMLAAGAPRFLTMTFYFYIYIWIGWSGSLQTYLWRFPWPIVHTRDDLAIGLGQIILAIIFYEIGQFLARGHSRKSYLRGIDTPVYQLSLNRLVVLWLFAFVGFAYGVAYFGIDGILGTRRTFGTGIAADPSQVGFVIARSLLRAPSFIVFFASAHLVLHHWQKFNRSHKRLVALILMTSAGLAFIANYPPAVARSWLGVVLIAPVMLLAPWGRRASLFWVLALTFILTWVYPRADLFRYSSSLGEALQRLEQEEIVRKHVMSVDFSELQMTTNCYVYVQHNGFMWGNNLLSAALFFVPRSLWPGKAERSDLVVAKALGYRQKNLSSAYWSESYMAFGLPGLALLLLLYGYGSQWLEQRYVLARLYGQIATAGPLALMIPFWGAYQFYFLRGNLITAVGYSALPLALMWYLYRRNKPVNTPPETPPLSRTPDSFHQ